MPASMLGFLVLLAERSLNCGRPGGRRYFVYILSGSRSAGGWSVSGPRYFPEGGRAGRGVVCVAGKVALTAEWSFGVQMKDFD